MFFLQLWTYQVQNCGGISGHFGALCNCSKHTLQYKKIWRLSVHYRATKMPLNVSSCWQLSGRRWLPLQHLHYSHQQFQLLLHCTIVVATCCLKIPCFESSLGDNLINNYSAYTGWLYTRWAAPLWLLLLSTSPAMGCDTSTSPTQQSCVYSSMLAYIDHWTAVVHVRSSLWVLLKKVCTHNCFEKILIGRFLWQYGRWFDKASNLAIHLSDDIICIVLL